MRTINVIKLGTSGSGEKNGIIKNHILGNVSVRLSRNKVKDFPMQGERFIDCIIYHDTVTKTQNRHKETFIGLTEDPFKTRFEIAKDLSNIKTRRGRPH